MTDCFGYSNGTAEAEEAPPMLQLPADSPGYDRYGDGAERSMNPMSPTSL